MSSIGIRTFALVALLTAAFVALGAGTSLVYAQDDPDPNTPSLIPSSGTLGAECNFKTGQFKVSCIPAYIRYLIRVIWMFIGSFFLISIIFSGYQIALGSITGQKEAGKERLKWSIVGFCIAGFSFLIIDFVIAALATGL